MAPKTRGGGVGVVGTKRKRSVRRPAREPTPPSSSSSPSSSSPPHATATNPQVDHLAASVIVSGRHFDFELFEKEGLFVGIQLKEMGFEKICSLECPTYPALVKEFYKNLSRGDNGLVSKVRGIGLNITPVILSKLLDLPLSGPSSFEPEDRSPALKRLLDKDFEQFEEVSASQLPMDLRLLHNICSRILFPKTGRFDYVSERDVFVMDAVISGRPINLPSMILWYMADCGSKKRSCLPYGMILTHLFRSQGVVISDSEPKKKLRHTDYYSLATIHRMGFTKVNGNWIRKGKERVREEIRTETVDADIRLEDFDFEVEAGPSMAGPSVEAGPSTIYHSPPPPTSLKFSDDQMSQLKDLFMEFDNQRKTEINQLKELIVEADNKRKIEMDQLKDEIREIKETISSKVNSMSISLNHSCHSFNDKLNDMFEKLQSIFVNSTSYTDTTKRLRTDINEAVDQIHKDMKNFMKFQKEDFMEIIGHLKKIVFKHT